MQFYDDVIWTIKSLINSRKLLCNIHQWASFSQHLVYVVHHWSIKRTVFLNFYFFFLTYDVCYLLLFYKIYFLLDLIKKNSFAMSKVEHTFRIPPVRKHEEFLDQIGHVLMFRFVLFENLLEEMNGQFQHWIRMLSVIYRNKWSLIWSIINQTMVQLPYRFSS